MLLHVKLFQVSLKWNVFFQLNQNSVVPANMMQQDKYYLIKI